MKNRELVRGVWVLLLVPLAACTIAPEAASPAVSLPASFRHIPKDAKVVSSSAWWRQFNDPALTRHIETALANNLDLAEAAAVLSEFDALYSKADGETGPQVKLQGMAQRGRTLGITSSSYSVTALPSWEIDFWGKLRNTRAAARSDVLAKTAAREAIRLTIISSVATSYVELLELDKRLTISQRTLEGRQKSLRLAQSRFNAGQVSRIDQRQAEAEYQGVVFQVRRLEQQVEEKENAMSLLLGGNPASPERGRTLDALTVPAVPAGLPSDLLARRPDLLEAAEDLSAAAARLGVAKASMYPSISLTGLLGRTSTQFSTLFRSAAGAWAFAPMLNLPLFDGGQSRAQVDVSRARMQQAEIAYQKAVRNALSDAENALVGVEKIREQEQAQTARVVALRSYEQLTRRLYEGGEKDSSDFLDAQRQLLDAENTLAATQSGALKSIVALYKALGGDWDGVPASVTPSSR